MIVGTYARGSAAGLADWGFPFVRKSFNECFVDMLLRFRRRERFLKIEQAGEDGHALGQPGVGGWILDSDFQREPLVSDGRCECGQVEVFAELGGGQQQRSHGPLRCPIRTLDLDDAQRWDWRPSPTS